MAVDSRVLFTVYVTYIIVLREINVQTTCACLYVVISRAPFYFFLEYSYNGT